MRGQRTVALINFAAVRSTPLRRTVLLKYSAMVLLSSSSSEIASTKAKFAWKSRGVVSAVSAVVIPSEAADSKAAQHSASAAAMAAARRSGDKVEAVTVGAASSAVSMMVVVCSKRARPAQA